MKTKAAAAWKSGAPLTIEDVELQGTKAGEVLVEVKATDICHTDWYTLSGAGLLGANGSVGAHKTWKHEIR